MALSCRTTRPGSPVNGAREAGRQPRASVGRRPGWTGRSGCGPGRAEIGQFGLQALDLEPQHPPAGKDQGHHAGGASSRRTPPPAG